MTDASGYLGEVIKKELIKKDTRFCQSVAVFCMAQPMNLLRN